MKSYRNLLKVIVSVFFTLTFYLGSLSLHAQETSKIVSVRANDGSSRTSKNEIIFDIQNLPFSSGISPFLTLDLTDSNPGVIKWDKNNPDGDVGTLVNSELKSLVYKYGVSSKKLGATSNISFQLNTKNEVDNVFLFPSMEKVATESQFQLSVDGPLIDMYLDGSMLQKGKERIIEPGSYKARIEVEDTLEKDNFLRTIALKGFPRSKIGVCNSVGSVKSYSNDPKVSIDEKKNTIQVTYETDVSITGNRSFEVIAKDSDWDASRGIWDTGSEEDEDDSDPSFDTPTANITTRPKTDHPDDNEDIISEAADFLLPSGESQIALLRSGFFVSTGKLFESMGQKYTLVNPDQLFKLSHYYPLLVIPTGGLRDLTETKIFKKALEEYINQGGTLVIFSQQKGRDFSILPGAIEGIGWDEDQSCSQASLGIKSFHPTLSSLESNVIDFYVDGFFTNYPEDSSEILSRTINGYPAVIRYNYGSGRVLASSIYMDWGGRVGQVHEKEKLVLRDMISWGIGKEEVKTFSVDKGEIPAFDITIKNEGSKTIKRIRFTSSLPKTDTSQEEQKHVQEISVSALPGEELTIPFEYQGNNRSLGIWNVTAEVFYEGEVESFPLDKLWQFALHKDLSEMEDPEIQITLTSEKEYAYVGDSIKFTTTIKNNTNLSQEYALHYTELHCKHSSSKILTIPPNETEMHEVFIHIPYYAHLGLLRLKADGYKHKYLTKGFYILKNDLISCKVSTDKKIYSMNEMMNIHIDGLLKEGSAGTTFNPRLRIYNSENDLLHEETKELTIDASGEGNHELGISFSEQFSPQNTFEEEEELFIEFSLLENKELIYRDTQKVESVRYDYEVNNLSITSSRISFSLENDSNFDGPESELLLRLRDLKTGAQIYTKEQALSSLPSSTIQHFEFDFPATQEYSADIVVKHLEKGFIFEKHQADFSLKFVPSLNLEKIYKNGDEIDIIATVKNTGLYKGTQTLQIELPEIAYSSQEVVTLEPGESKDILREISFYKEDMIYGNKSITIKCLETNTSFMFPFSVLPADIDISYPEVLEAGVQAGITFKNSGDIWTSFDVDIQWLDSEGKKIFEQSFVNLSIDPQSEKQVSIPTPEGVLSGKYLAKTKIHNTSNLRGNIYDYREIPIDGFSSDLDIFTGTEYYLTSQNIDMNAELSNVTGKVEGNVHIDITVPEGGASSGPGIHELDIDYAGYEETDFTKVGGKLYYIKSDLDEPYTKRVYQVEEDGSHVQVTDLLEDPYDIMSNQDGSELWVTYYDNNLYRYKPETGEMTSFYVNDSGRYTKKVLTGTDKAWVYLWINSSNTKLFEVDYSSGQVTEMDGWKNPANYNNRTSTISDVVLKENQLWLLRKGYTSYSSDYRYSVSLHKYDATSGGWNYFLGDDLIQGFSSGNSYKSNSMVLAGDYLYFPVAVASGRSSPQEAAQLVKFDTTNDSPGDVIFLPDHLRSIEYFTKSGDVVALIGNEYPYNKLCIVDLSTSQITSTLISSNNLNDEALYKGKNIFPKTFGPSSTEGGFILGFEDAHNESKDLLRYNRFEKKVSEAFEYDLASNSFSLLKSSIEGGKTYSLGDTVIFNPGGHGYYLKSGNSTVEEVYASEEERIKFYYKLEESKKNSTFKVTSQNIWFNDHLGVKCYSLFDKNITVVNASNSGLSTDNIMDIMSYGNKVLFLGYHQSGITLDIFDEVEKTWVSVSLNGLLIPGENENKYPYFIHNTKLQELAGNNLYLTSYQADWGCNYLRFIKVNIMTGEIQTLLGNDFNISSISMDDSGELDLVFVENEDRVSFLGGWDSKVCFFDKSSFTLESIEHMAGYEYDIFKAGKSELFLGDDNIWLVRGGMPNYDDLFRFNHTHGAWTRYTSNNSSLTGGAVVEVMPYGDNVYFLEQENKILSSSGGDDGHGYGGAYYQTLYRIGKMHKYSIAEDQWEKLPDEHRDTRVKFKGSTLLSTYPDYQNGPLDPEDELDMIIEKKNLITGDNQVILSDISSLFDGTPENNLSDYLEAYEYHEVYDPDMGGTDYYHLTLHGLSYELMDYTSKSAMFKLSKKEGEDNQSNSAAPMIRAMAVVPPPTPSGSSSNCRYIIESFEGQSIADFSIDIPVLTQVDKTFTANIDPLSLLGRYHYKGVLTNTFGQTLGQDFGAFYIIDGKFLLKISHDKGVYKTNEAIPLQVSVKNLGGERLENVPFILEVDGEVLRDENLTFEIGQEHSYTHTIFKTDSFPYKGTIGTQEIQGDIEVSAPTLIFAVEGPDFVGDEAFNITATLKNDGIVPVNANLQFHDHALIPGIQLKPNETKVIRDSFSTGVSTSYEVKVTGDILKTQTVPVSYDKLPVITVNPNEKYEVGFVRIPLLVENKGSIGGECSFNLSLSQGGVPVDVITKNYNLKGNEKIEDFLALDLEAGNYTLTTGDNTSSSFTVLNPHEVTLEMIVGELLNGVYSVQVKVNNKGYYVYEGDIELGVSGYLQSQDVLIQPGEDHTLNFEFKLENVEQESDVLKASALLNDDVIASTEQSILFPNSEFTLLDSPEGSLFNINESASFIFKVKNTGGRGGTLNFSLNAGELQEGATSIFIEAGQEEELDFSFIVPSDLASGEYFAQVTINGEEQNISFQIQGYDMSFNGVLNKNIFLEGETARFTLSIQDNNQMGDIELAALVRYDGEEQQQEFILNDNASINFDIPTKDLESNYFHVQVGHTFSRESLYINTFDINLLEGLVTLATQKSDYYGGDEVVLDIVTEKHEGILNVDIPGLYSEQLDLASGVRQLNFILPEEVNTHSHVISYSLEDEIKEATLDVHGYEAIIKNSQVDKERYNGEDTLLLSLQILSNEKVDELIFYSEVKSFTGKYYEPYEISLNLEEGMNQVEIPIPLDLTNSGMHQLDFALYKNDAIVANQSEAFDVGNANIQSLSIKGYTVKQGEPIELEVTLVGQGQGLLSVFLDYSEESIYEQGVTLQGEEKVIISLPPMEEIGKHELKVIYDDGLIAENNTDFIITDGTAPKSSYDIQKGPYFSSDGTTYVTSQTRIALKAFDNASGIEVILYTLNSDTWNVYQGPMTLTQAGLNNLVVKSIDLNNNMEEEKTFQLYLDDLAPTTTLTEEKTESGVILRLESEDEGSGLKETYYSLDGEAPVQGIELLIQETGEHSFEYWSIDQLGNEEEKKTFSFFVDYEKPVTTHNYGNLGKWNKEEVTIELTGTDSLSGVKGTYYQINEEEAVEGNLVTLSDEGVHSLKFWSEDNYGNIEDPQMIEVKIDKTMPLISVASPEEDSVFKPGDSVTLDYEISDELSGIKESQVLLNGATDISNQTSFEVSEGDSSLVFKAEDQAGNTFEKIVTFEVRATVEVGVVIKPEVIWKNWGYLMAFICLPEDYRVHQIESIECDGVSPRMLIKRPCWGRYGIAFFKVRDFQDIDRHFIVTGQFKDGVSFEGHDSIRRVISWKWWRRWGKWKRLFCGRGRR